MLVLCGVSILIFTVISNRLKLAAPQKLAPVSTLTATDRQHSYVLAVRYAEQLTSGIRNALQLGHLFKEHNSKLVEPFVLKSRLFGIPKLLAQADLSSRVKPLGSFLDFIEVSSKCYDIDEPVSFRNFLETSTRELVLLHPVRSIDHTRSGEFGSFIPKRRLEELHDCVQMNNHVCECQDMLKEFKTAVEESLNSYIVDDAPFTVRFVICFDADQVMTLNSLLETVHVDTPLSYLFTFWYGTACKKSPPTLQPTNSSSEAPGSSDAASTVTANLCTSTHRTHIVPWRDLPSKCSKTGSITDSFLSVDFVSRNIKDLATAFLEDQQLLSPEKMVAIHYRTEWLALKSQETINCCLKEVRRLFDGLFMEVDIQLDNSILITDTGPYGSQSCSKTCAILARVMLKSLKSDHKLTPVYFDPVDYGGSKDSLVAALVEYISLTRGKYLVLIGGGKFQRSILTSALQGTNLKRVYSVCSPTTRWEEGIPSEVDYHSLNECLSESEDDESVKTEHQD